MTTPENTFIASVHAHLPPPSKLYRMKNHNAYTAGVADSWYSGQGPGSRDLWIEWKFIKVPVRDDTLIVPNLSALQTDWLNERYVEGRNVWVGIGSKDGGIFLHAMEWEQPFSAKEFRRTMFKRKELASMIASFVQGSG